MKRMLPLLFVLPTILLIAADDKKSDDHKNIMGKWKPVEFHVNDMKVDPPEDGILTITEDTIDQQSGDNHDKAKYKLDPTKKPKELDVTIERDGKTQTMKMIYELDGDTLKFCGKANPDEATMTRPKEISSKEGQVMIVLKREKPADKAPEKKKRP